MTLHSLLQVATTMIPSDLSSYIMDGAGLIIVGLQGWLIRTTNWTKDEVIKLRLLMTGEDTRSGFKGDLDRLRKDVDTYFRPRRRADDLPENIDQ